MVRGGGVRLGDVIHHGDRLRNRPNRPFRCFPANLDGEGAYDSVDTESFVPRGPMSGSCMAGISMLFMLHLWAERISSLSMLTGVGLGPEDFPLVAAPILT